MLKKNYLLGVAITNEREESILEYLFTSLKKEPEKYFITTPNPEILVYANTHPDYKKILNAAKIALPDGVGLFLGSALVGHTLKERITGVDFMEEICKRSAGRTLSIGLLGGRGGVADKAAECLKIKYPWLNVVFVGEEWVTNSKFKVQNSKLKIDILFVAFGHPKQEEWISENLHKLPVKIAMGVGGAFDYISGNVTRAPFMVRAIGFEWLYRLIKQPWRWHRQLALIKFIWLVLKEFFQQLSKDNPR